MADTQINIGINLDSDNLIKGIDNAQYKIKALGNVISGVSVAALEAALSNLPTQKVKDVAASFESVSKSLQNTPQKELAQPLAKVNAKELKGVGEGIAAIAAALTAFDENKLNQVSQGLANVSLVISQLPIGNIQKLTTELKSINKISGEIQPTNLQNTATAISALNKEITGLSYVQLSQVAVATGQLNLQINGIKEAAVATKELSKAANEIKPTLLAEFSATAKDLPTKNADAFANAIKSLANNTTALSSNALSEISKASLVIAGQTTNLQGSAAAIKTIGENSKTIDPKPLNAIIDSTNKANPDLISKAATSISGLIKEVGNVSYAPLTNVAVAISQVGLQLNSIKETVTNTKDLTKAINELKAAPFNELSTSIKALTPKSIDDFANAVKSLEKNVSATSANNLNEISKSVAGISGQLNSVQSIATSIKILSDSLKEVDFKPLKGLVEAVSKINIEPITKTTSSLSLLSKEINTVVSTPLNQLSVSISQIGSQINLIKDFATNTKELSKQLNEIKPNPISQLTEISKGLPLKSVDDFSNSVKSLDKSIVSISANNLNEVNKSSNLIVNQSSLIQNVSDSIKSLGVSLKSIDSKPLNSAIDASSKANAEPIKQTSKAIIDLNKSIMGIFPTLISDVAFNASKLGNQNATIKTAALNFDSLSVSVKKVNFSQITDFSKAASSLSPKNIDSIATSMKALGSSIMGIFPSILTDTAKSASELGGKSVFVKSTADAVQSLSTSLSKVQSKPLDDAVSAASRATYTPLLQTADAVNKLTLAINGIFPTLLSDVAFSAQKISFQNSAIKLASDNTKDLAKSILELKVKPFEQLSSAINSLSPKSVGEFSNGLKTLDKSINVISANSLNEVGKSANIIIGQTTLIQAAAEAFKLLGNSLKVIDFKPLNAVIESSNKANAEPVKKVSNSIIDLNKSIMGIFPTLISDISFNVEKLGNQNSIIKTAAINFDNLSIAIKKVNFSQVSDFSKAASGLSPKNIDGVAASIKVLGSSIMNLFPSILIDVAKGANDLGGKSLAVKSTAEAVHALSTSLSKLQPKPLEEAVKSANQATYTPLTQTASAVTKLTTAINGIFPTLLSDVAFAAQKISFQNASIKLASDNTKDLSKSISELKTKPFEQLSSAISSLTPKAVGEFSNGIKSLEKSISSLSANNLNSVSASTSSISAQTPAIQATASAIKSLSDSIKDVDHKPLKNAVESGSKANAEPISKAALAIKGLAKEISEVSYASLSNVAVAAGQIYLQANRIKETAQNIKELGTNINSLTSSSEKLTATSKNLEKLLVAATQISKISAQINSQKIVELDSAIAKINTTVLPVITTQLKELSDSVKLVSNSTIKKLSDSINLVNINKLNETTAAILALTPALNAISTSNISATVTYLKEITETKKGVSDLNNAIKEFNSVTQKVTEKPYAGVSKELDNLSKKVTAVNSNKILDIGAGLELIGGAAVKLNPQVVSHLSKNISDLTKQTVQLNAFASTAKTLSTNINAINPQIVNALATAISKINDTKTEAAGKALKNIGDAISSLKTNILLDTAAGLELIGTSQTFVAQTSKHIVNVSNALVKMSAANKQLASVSDNIGYIGINVGTIKSGILNNLANYSQQLGNSAPKLREFRDVLKEISKAADGIKSKGLVSLTNLIVGFNTNKIIEISLDLIDLSQVLAAIPVDKLKQLNAVMKVSVTGNLKVTADSLERIGKAVMNIFPSLIQDAVAAMKGFAGVGASVQRAASSLSDFAKANNEIKPKQLNAIGAAFDKFAKGLIKLDVNKISDAASAIEKLSVVIANINTQPLLNTAAGVANIGVIAKVTTKEINALFDALSKPQQTPEQKAAAEAEKQRLKEEKEAKKAAAAAEKQRIKEEKAAAKEAAEAEKRAAKELREAEKAAAKEAAAAKKAEIEATKKLEQEKVNFAKKLLREELAAKKAVAEQDKVLAGVERASDLASKKYQAVQKYLDLEQEHAAKVRQAIKAFDLKSYEENANAAKKAHEDAKKAREAADISTNEYSKRALAFVEIAHTRAAALGKALEQKTNQLKSLSENATKAERAAAEASVKIAKEAADKAVKIAQDAANKAAQIKQVDRPVVAKNPELEQWASTRGFREAFYEIGREIKSFFTESFHTFKEFDDQVRKAASLMGTEFLTTVNEINKSSLKLSETTRYTATQIAESFGVLAMNGLNLKEAMSAIPVVLDLAEAGAYSVERTTEILIGTVHSFNLSVDSMKSVANAMTNAMTTSALSMQRIAYTVQYAGTTADAANQSFGQMLGIMGVLANQNIVGSKAGTALRTAYLELQVEGGKLTRTLQDLAQRQVALDGVTNEGTATAQQFATAQKDAAGKVRPLIDVLEDMKVKGANAGDVFNAFGKYAMGSINALIKPGQTLAESIDKVRVQQERVFGITEKTAKQFVMNMRSGVSETATVLNKFGIDVLATDAKIGKTTAIKDIFSVMADAKQKGADFAEIAKTFVKGWDTKEGRKEFELLMKVFNSGKTTAKELADAYSDANGRANEVAQQMESGIGGAVRKLQGAYQALQIKIWESFSDETVEKVLNVKKALVASTPAIANITGVFIKAGLVIVDAALAFLKFTDYHSGAIIALGALAAAIVILKYQLIELTAAMLGRVVGGFVATTASISATAFSVSTLSGALIGLGTIAKNLGWIALAAGAVYTAFSLITTAMQAWNASSDEAAKSQELVKSLKDKKEALEKAGYTEQRINELNAEQLQTYKAGLIGQLGVIDEIKMRKESGLSISKQEREELQKEAQLRKELGMIKNRFVEDPKIKQSAVAQKEEMEREAAQRQAILDSQTAKYKKLSEIQLAGEIAYTQALQKGNSYLEEREKSAIQKNASVDIAQINQETAALEARARASVLSGKGEKFDEAFYLNKAKRIADIELKATEEILTIEKNRVTAGSLLNDKMYILKKTQAENTIKDGDQLNRKMNDLERENIEARISLQEKYYKSIQSAYQKISKEIEDFKLKSINIEKDIVAEKTSLQDKLFDLKLKDRNKQLDLERSLANEKMSLEDKLFELRLKNKSEPEKQAAYSAKSSELIAKAFAPTADIETSKKLLDNAESMVSKINDATVAESLLTEISRRRLELLSREKGDRDNALKQQKEINLSVEEALKKSQELARAGDLKGSVEYGKIAEIAKAKDAFIKAKSLADAGDIEGSKKLLESAEQQASKLERVKDAEKLITDISTARVALLEKEKAANQARITASEEYAAVLGLEESSALMGLQNYQNEIGKLSETGMTFDLEAKLDAGKLKEELGILKKEVDAMNATVTVHHATSGGEGFSANPQMRNAGGWVDGVGDSDTVPAMLTPNEYVVTARQDRSKKAAPILEFLNKAPISKVTTFVERVKNGVTKLNAGGFVMPRLNPSMLMNLPNLGNLPKPSAPKDRYLQPFVLNLGGKNMPPLPTPEENMREFILALQQS